MKTYEEIRERTSQEKPVKLSKNQPINEINPSKQKKQRIEMRAGSEAKNVDRQDRL